jgi:predicted ribosomally synthesized peptide with nif11-like leader
MSKSEELQRMERDLSEQPELREKLYADIKRITDTGEAACDGEAVAKAAASLGYKITPEELKRAVADSKELSESDMEQISAGNFFADLEEVLRRIFADDKKDTQQNNPSSLESITARGKC